MALPDYSNYVYPDFNTGGNFPYQNFLQQLQASFMARPMNSYGRWNGTGVTTPQGYPAPNTTPNGPPGGYSGGLLKTGGPTGGPTPAPAGGPAPAPTPQGAVPPDYNYSGSMWGGNGPIQASTLGQNDQMYLNALMHLPGGPGAISQMLGGSNTDVRNAIDNINATNPAALNGYDFNSYNGPLKQQFADYFAKNGGLNVPGGFQNPITGQYSTQGLPGIFQQYFANNPTQAAQFAAGGTKAIKR